MEMYLWVLLAAAAIGVLWFTGFAQKFLRYIYGDFTPAERNKFLLYGTLLFVVIGVYWAFRCIKDPIFSAFVGSEHTWMAKIVSMLVVFPLVIVYSYLVDIFPRHRLFYALSAVFAVLFLSAGWLLSNPSFGINAPREARWAMLGWFTYTLIETYGTLLVAMFYSFMADTTTPEAGKKGFFVTATFAQVGQIIGSTLVAKQAACWGVTNLMMIAALVTLTVIPLVAYINWVIPKAEFAGYQTKGETNVKQSKPGFWEGLRLFVSQPYLLGIFIVVFAFEAVVTVMDLQFKILIQEATKAGGAGDFAVVTGQFGTAVGILALASLLLGIGNIGRKIGLRLSLALIPVLIAGSVLAMLYASGNASALNVAFWVCVLAKGINYALGQPSKEQLFIPTSRDAKYKSKAWVDMFGSRSSKASGSFLMGIKQTVFDNMGMIGGFGAGILFVSAMSFGICAIWLFVALYLGKRHREAVARNEVVC